MTHRESKVGVALRLNGITKRFGNALANDSIDLSVHQGEIVALLGENGAGKTTLMNILFGHYVQDSGTVEVFGQLIEPGSPRRALSAGVGMVHQHFNLADNLTVLDNILIGTEPLWRPRSNRTAARQRLRSLMHELGFNLELDCAVGPLSVGERQRVEILKVLYRGARVLILDEPSAVLAPIEAKTLFATLRRLADKGLSIIFISHKLKEILSFADRVVVLRSGKVAGQRTVNGCSEGELAALMIGRASAAVAKSSRRAPGAPVLKARDLTVTDKEGGTLLDAINLTVRRGEIVGIAGVSGNGQSALADLVSGTRSPCNGTLEIMGKAVRKFTPQEMLRLKVGRIPEDRHKTGVIGDFPVWENAILEQYKEDRFSRLGYRNLAQSRQFADKIISKYDVRGNGASSPTRLLSGGNMQKLILGRVMEAGPQLLLACHPSRGLDAGATTGIHERLIDATDQGAGVLLISDDLDEILAIADVVVVMYSGRIGEPCRREDIHLEQLGMAMSGGVRRAH